MREWQSQSHDRWYCRYHVVWVPKYRKRAVRRQTNPDHCGCVARETSCRCAAWCGVL